MLGLRTRVLGLALMLATVWAGCIVEETDGERSRFGDESTSSSAAQTGAGGFAATTGAGANNATGGTGATGSSSSVTTGSGAGGPGCNYSAPNSCLSADTIPEIAGDAGTDLRVLKGTTSKFFKVWVKETVGSIFSYPSLKFAARLDNSADMDFDLNVYVAGDEPNCDGEVVGATAEPAVVTGSWEDNGNNDDGRWILFEVDYAGGTECGDAASWTLTLAGNYDIRCDTDGTCNADDDCVCPDCHQTASCDNACDDDGTCDTANEGCGCVDCQGTPACL